MAQAHAMTLGLGALGGESFHFGAGNECRPARRFVKRITVDRQPTLSDEAINNGTRNAQDFCSLRDIHNFLHVSSIIPYHRRFCINSNVTVFTLDRINRYRYNTADRFSRSA